MACVKAKGQARVVIAGGSGEGARMSRDKKEKGKGAEPSAKQQNIGSCAGGLVKTGKQQDPSGVIVGLPKPPRG